MKVTIDSGAVCASDAGVHPNIEISNVQDCVKLKSMLESARRIENV